MIAYKLEEQRGKIEKICSENELEYTFSTVDFPVVATVKPNYATAAQIKMEIKDDEESTDPEARIEFQFGHELVVKNYGEFIIEDDILNKIKAGFKKLHYLYLQLYFLQTKTNEKKKREDQENTNFESDDEVLGITYNEESQEKSTEEDVSTDNVFDNVDFDDYEVDENTEDYEEDPEIEADKGDMSDYNEGPSF